MKLRTARRLGLVGILFTGLVAVIAAQQPGNNGAGVGFNDPVFWQLVETGPATSDEVEHVVTTYAANGMTGEVTNAFADYLQRSDFESDPFCDYCSGLLSKVDAPEDEAALIEALRDAMDIVAEAAFQRGASDTLVRVAVMTGVSSHRKHRDHALYFLTIASQFEIEDSWRDDVALLLAHIGLHDEALTIASSLYEDPGSAHFQSASLGPWITYLNREIERNRQVSSIIMAAMD